MTGRAAPFEADGAAERAADRPPRLVSTPRTTLPSTARLDWGNYDEEAASGDAFTWRGVESEAFVQRLGECMAPCGTTASASTIIVTDPSAATASYPFFRNVTSSVGCTQLEVGELCQSSELYPLDSHHVGRVAHSTADMQLSRHPSSYRAAQLLCLPSRSYRAAQLLCFALALPARTKCLTHAYYAPQRHG